MDRQLIKKDIERHVYSSGQKNEPQKGRADRICVQHFFTMDKTVSIMLIKSVNSTKLYDIANPLNIGIRTKINRMKLNRHNRNCCVQVESSSDVCQNC